MPPSRSQPIPPSRPESAHANGRAGEIDICSRCCTTIPHPLLVTGSLLFHARTVRRLLPAVERLTYFAKLPRKLLRPSRRGARRASKTTVS